MRRERYVFNKQTLRYEKVVEPLSTTLLRGFGFTCAALFTAFVFTLLAHRYFPSPNEKELQAKVERLESFIESESEQSLGELQKVVGNLQKRDAYVHRMIFGMDPIDENIWNGGTGGHDAYGEFEIYGSSGDLMSDIKQKIDRLKHQINIQSRSLDTIVGLAKDKEVFLASMPTIKPVRSDLLSKDLRLLSGFGSRLHPVFKVMRMHNGIDFTAKIGTPIVATGDGQVVRAERAGGFGNLVVIKHGNGYESYYGHMSRIDVKPGQKVQRGQQIGAVGSTGTSTAPHCHYEVHYHGSPVNPLSFVMDGLTPAEYKALTEAAETVNQSLH
jgi:murein DD-endopeptidase MepM/ murein hydrolase activator NlpD